jgi:hypothetical protein
MFLKIQEGVDKVDAGNAPYTVNQVLAITFDHVFWAGIMQSTHEGWTSLTQMNKTWANFQDMFTQAHETYKSLIAQRWVPWCKHGPDGELQCCTQHTQSESFYTETADAFDNLAIAATSDKYLLSTLTSTNTALTGQLAKNDWLVANVQAQIRNTATNTNTDRPKTQANTNY